MSDLEETANILETRRFTTTGKYIRFFFEKDSKIPSAVAYLY